MNHDNRGRLTIDVDGNWRLYATHLPATGRALGTVTANDETGALVYIERTGIYVRCNAGVSVALPQRKVQMALDDKRAPGRPAELDGGKRVQVYLDAKSLTIASKLGSGNVSEGIRLALSIAATTPTLP